MKIKFVISFLMAYSLLLLLSSTMLASPCPCADCPACYESTGQPDCDCVYVGCDPPCDTNECYDCNDSCECEYQCDPNLCEVCVDGNCVGCDLNLCYDCNSTTGACEDRCGPNLCEVCDGNGVCEVCDGDPNKVCCDGVCTPKCENTPPTGQCDTSYNEQCLGCTVIPNICSSFRMRVYTGNEVHYCTGGCPGECVQINAVECYVECECKYGVQLDYSICDTVIGGGVACADLPFLWWCSPCVFNNQECEIEYAYQ